MKKVTGDFSDFGRLEGKRIIQSNLDVDHDFCPGLVSIISPCFNEERNIEPFLDSIAQIHLKDYEYEIIITNDRSTDESGRILHEQSKHDNGLQIIHFPRNFGQQQALMAGIRAARGEILVTLDIDLQHPPSLIPEMISLYEKGFQVVHAIPQYKSGSISILKKWTSRLYYLFIRLMGSRDVVNQSNDFRLVSHSVAEVIRTLPEHNLYIRGIIAWLCPLVSKDEKLMIEVPSESKSYIHDTKSHLWRASSIPYFQEPRQRGETKYTWIKMVNLAIDGLMTSTIQPLRIGIFLVIISIFLSISMTVYALYMRLVVGGTVSGWTSLMIVLLFFGSVQFIVLGMMGQYIGKIFLQVRGRPGYFVADNKIENYWSDSKLTSLQYSAKSKNHIS